MDKLALSSFEIQGFRAFDSLKIEKLGRVNLFVGKNNVGKTSLLEALWIYASQGSPSVLWSLLEGRDEGGPLRAIQTTSEEDIQSQIAALHYLFHGRSESLTDLPEMIFGPIGSALQQVRIRFVWTDEQGTQLPLYQQSLPLSLNERAGTIPALAVQFGEKSSLFRLDRYFMRDLRNQFASKLKNPCVFLPANGLSMADIRKYWDAITLSPLEDDILETMKIIQPDIERINLVENQASVRSGERIPVVRTSSLDSPVPLRSLGEGMNRLFGLALAMVNAKNGLVLIDEIESGLHYSVLPEMWHFIFKTANLLNVQVFATTHSWDCISGFQQAAQAHDEDGLLIRLVNKKGTIVPTIFDEKDLAVVTRDQIEVR